jgi:hypothetical protein
MSDGVSPEQPSIFVIKKIFHRNSFHDGLPENGDGNNRSI